MKHLKDFKIFENKSIDWNNIVDSFLYRYFDEVLDLRTDIQIFHERKEITNTPEEGAYLEFIEDLNIISLSFSKLDDYYSISYLIIKCIDNFKDWLEEIGIELNVDTHGVIMNPYDFRPIYRISMKIKT